MILLSTNCTSREGTWLRIAQVKIRPFLVVGGTPNGDRLAHRGLPAEFVDRRVKAHAGKQRGLTPMALV